MRLPFICGAMSMCMAVATLVSASVTNYNLTNDFSTANNPNGAWAYRSNGGYAPARATSYAIGWGPASDFNGAIAVVTNPTSWHDAQVGDVVMHAPNSGNHDVAWTSPEAGFIVLSGKVWDAFFASGRDSSWVLKVNGTTIASRNTIFGTFRTDAVADFANNLALGQSLGPIAVSANDMVTLSTIKNTSFGHFAGVELNIEFTNIPEPASLGLLALGSVLLARRRCPRIPA